MLEKIVTILLLGVCILIVAIILNLIAVKLGLLTWYEFLNDYSKINTMSLFWLFLIYPFCLGAIAYFAIKLFK